ncbi:MAG: hypothetical protein ACI9U2_002040 [Bradymonadia bacterium]
MITPESVMRLFLYLSLCLIAFTTGCDEDTAAPAEPAPNLAEEACEHTVQGPFADVDAALDVGDAPAVTFPHTATRVALAGGDDQQYVRFDAPEAGEYTIFLSTDLPISLSDANGDAFSLMSGVVDGCTEVAMQHAVDLPVGSVFIGLTAPSASTVSIVVEEAEHSDEEHSDEEHSDEEHSDEEHSDEEHSDEEHSDEEHADE